MRLRPSLPTNLQMQMNLLSDKVDGFESVLGTGDDQSLLSTSRPISFSDLPLEIQVHILSYLPLQSLLQVVEVCSAWKNSAEDDLLWLRLFRAYYPLCYLASLSGSTTSSSSTLPSPSSSSASTKWVTKLREAGTGWKSIFVRKYKTDSCWKKKPYMRAFPAHEELLRTLQYDETRCLTTTDLHEETGGISEWNMSDLLAPAPASVYNWENKPDEAICSNLAPPNGFVKVKNPLALQFDNELDLLIHSADGNIHIRSAKQFRNLKKTLNLHSSLIWTLQFSKDKLVTGSRDQLIKITDLEYGQTLETLTGHENDIRYLRWANNIIVSHGDDNSICIWDMRTGKLTNSLDVGSDNGWVCQFDEDKIMCNGRHSIEMWDFRTLKLRMKANTTHSVRFASYDHTKIIAGTQHNRVEIMDLDSGDRTNTVDCFRDTYNMTGILTFQYDEDILIAGLHDSRNPTLVVMHFTDRYLRSYETPEVASKDH